jgi:hypothetical protein
LNEEYLEQLKDSSDEIVLVPYVPDLPCFHRLADDGRHPEPAGGNTDDN